MSKLHMAMEITRAFVRGAREELDYARGCKIEALAHYGHDGWSIVERIDDNGMPYRTAVRTPWWQRIAS